MSIRRCLACADWFPPSPRIPNQAYCTRPECQRERRRRWQREKRRSDEDYRSNQARCQERWRDSHPDYWQRYRAEHPEYATQNREKQRTRNAGRQGTVAKMDASAVLDTLRSGTYLLTRSLDGNFAKMDSWIVKITVLSTA
jgi:hypothetical protein